MIGKSFCDIDFFCICDKYRFEIIALSPQFSGFFKSHDEEGSGQAVAGQAVISDEGRMPETATPALLWKSLFKMIDKTESCI